MEALKQPLYAMFAHLGQASVLRGCVRDADPGRFVTGHNAWEVSWSANACSLELDNFRALRHEDAAHGGFEHGFGVQC